MRAIEALASRVFVPAEDLSRRQFLGGFGCLGASLAAGLVTMGPRSINGAPPRPVLAHPARRAPVMPPAVQYSDAFRQEWARFRTAYVTDDGRVLDTANGNVSHSEGQGWALMAAQAADDPASFARILDWTTATLQCRGDSLHAWCYKPGAANPVPDRNNATDGDLFIAAALARAAVRWHRPDYAERAARIGRDVLALVRQAGPYTVLLPGAAGFEKPDSVIINPSYYAFALFADLDALAPSPVWDAVRRDGAALLLQARFGRWGLPPDWMRVARHDGAVSIAPGWPPRFSYDAIRVPLHLVWGGQADPKLLDGFIRYMQSQRGTPPAWTDLATNATAPYLAPPGFLAVAALALQQPTLDATVGLPSVNAAPDYYNAGLILLSRLAAEERVHPAA